MTIQNVPLERLRPTEAYLCKESLEFLSHDRVEAEKPIKIVVDELGEYMLMDGHNKAFLAYQLGKTTVQAEVYNRENTPAGYGLEGFLSPERDRCKCLGVNCIRDLASRILPTRADVIAHQSQQNK